MDKNKRQLLIFGVVVVILTAAIAMTLLKPRSKPAAKVKNTAGASGSAVPEARKAMPQRERVRSSFKSWGRDPFTIGAGVTEQADGPVSLSGIFCDPQKSYCIIDGKVAKVGDEVSGYKILEITEDTVTIEAAGGIKTLKVGRY